MKYKTVSNIRVAILHSTTLSKIENIDKDVDYENYTESVQGETSEEPNTTPTDNTPQNPLQIPKTSFSKIFTRQIKNPSVKLQQCFSEVFSSEQLKLKMNVYDYNINEDLKLQIKHYENKNVIN